MTWRGGACMYLCRACGGEAGLGWVDMVVDSCMLHVLAHTNTEDRTMNELNLDAFSYCRDEYHGDGWYTAFDWDECRKCGVEAQAANAISLNLSSIPQRVMDGLDIRETLPTELGYCEEFGDAVCPGCWGQA